MAETLVTVALKPLLEKVGTMGNKNPSESVKRTSPYLAQEVCSDKGDY